MKRLGDMGKRCVLGHNVTHMFYDAAVHRLSVTGRSG